MFDGLVCKNNLTKNKFLWFFFDGMAFDEYFDLYEKKKGSAAFYKVTTEFFKQSGALHEIFLTGKFSRNFMAEKIQADNLLYQLNNSNIPIKFIGSEYPLYDLGGGRHTDPSLNFFADHYISRDRFPFYSLCPWSAEHIFYPVTFSYQLPAHLAGLNFQKEEIMSGLDGNFSNSLTTEGITSCFRDIDVCCREQTKNLIYYTQIIDAFNHGYSKEHPRTFAAAYAINKGISKIMEWIDNNPEYVLIISSDHGGQAYLGEDNYCNHGCNHIGNEGVLFIYMKDFQDTKPISEFQNIDIFEVTNIVSQLIENINIPLESSGKIKPFVQSSFKYHFYVFI